MGNVKRGKPWTVYADRGIAFLNTWIGRERIRASLGIPYNPLTASPSDVRAIEHAAAQRFAELIAGRSLGTAKPPRIATANTLLELVAMWLVDEKTARPKSHSSATIHARHIVAVAEDEWDDERTPLARMLADDGPQRYAYARLKKVKRITVRKELSTLFNFFAWALRAQHLTEMPPRPNLPKGAKGVRSGPQRERAVLVTHEEALEIIDALPEWSARGGGRNREKAAGAFRVRDMARFSYETALRPGTVQRLSVPRHWVPGSDRLLITGDIDKTQNERHVPLSRMAVSILERCAPESGIIFGVHDWRDRIKAAARKVLPKDRADDFARYDLRHSRATNTLEASGGNLLGVAHMLGHTQTTTTNKYLHPGERHAVRLLDTVSKVSAAESERKK